MREFVRRRLKKIIIKYGAKIFEQPRRLKALLNDLCPGCKKENFLLTTALAKNVVEDLLQLENTEIYQIKAEKLKQRLINECGIDNESADWVVDSWAYALGIINENDAMKMYQLGEKYFAAKDYKKAVIYFKKAADLGNAKGQKALGDMYQNGWKEKLNYKETPDWYRKAAISWYKKAAKQGDVDAQTILGSIYKRGWGVRQDFKKAINWYKKAAKAGHEFAQYNLGYLYQNGLGVKQNFKQALKWYQKSMRQGNDFAQRAVREIKEEKNSQ